MQGPTCPGRRCCTGDLEGGGGSVNCRARGLPCNGSPRGRIAAVRPVAPGSSPAPLVLRTVTGGEVNPVPPPVLAPPVPGHSPPAGIEGPRPHVPCPHSAKGVFRPRIAPVTCSVGHHDRGTPSFSLRSVRKKWRVEGERRKSACGRLEHGGMNPRKGCPRAHRKWAGRPGGWREEAEGLGRRPMQAAS